MSDQARAEILAAIRGALGTDIPARAREGSDQQPAPSIPAPSSEGLPALLERFCDRVRDYGAVASRVGRDEVAATVAEIAARHRARRLVVPAGLPRRWRAALLELVDDDERLGPRELERFDGALTAAALAVAETGTLVLDGGPNQGRRALTLLPDLHVCVVDAARVVADVPDAIAALEPALREHRRPVTFISGPSATADIELRRVQGVHGPRRLEVILAEDTRPVRG
jgi:L-lactate dehydrogenase complex protein LldG